MITQFSDSCGWKLQRLSQAGLQPWERGGTGGTPAALAGAAHHHLHPRKSAECQGSSQLASGVTKGGVQREFGNVSPERCPAERVLLRGCAVQQAGGQLSCSRGDAREQLVYYF